MRGNKKNTRQAGFTMFFAVLIAGIALTIGVVIYDLVSRELTLSQTTAQSQYAIYAADTGAECALYWDSKCTLSSCTCYAQNISGTCIAGSAFATSSTSAYPRSGLDCNSYDIAAHGVPPATFGAPPTGWTVWQPITSGPTTTTTFTLYLGGSGSSIATTPCVTVQTAKYLVGTIPHTVVTADGFNTCVTSTPNRVERELQLTY